MAVDYNFNVFTLNENQNILIQISWDVFLRIQLTLYVLNFSEGT